MKHWKIIIMIGFIFLVAKPLKPAPASDAPKSVVLSNGKKIELVIPTFLGNKNRNFSGIGPVPKKLNVIWKFQLGCGRTKVKGIKVWCGSGWTGQPALILENGHPYIIQSAYDWCLYKIDAISGKEIWKYRFDDVIKSSPSVFINPKAKTDEEKVVVISGSRYGLDKTLDSPFVPSLRGISYLTGRELWRFSMNRTRSYSRDCDSSALVFNNKIYIGLENGTMAILDPNDLLPYPGGGRYKTPRVLRSKNLYNSQDNSRHGGNLVTEASVARWESSIFIASGSGHVWQLSMKDLTPIWDFFTGSDIDGSSVVSSDGYIYQTIERQYIAGQGGVFKLDPASKKVVWYFPTKNRRFASWEGGVIGSVSLDPKRRLVAFTAIDGNIYIVSQDKFSSAKAGGPNLNAWYSSPEIMWSKNVGGAIATPIFVDDYLISTGYGGIYIFKISGNADKITVQQKDHFGSSFESTAIVYKGRIYVGSRDGNLYCFGNK